MPELGPAQQLVIEGLERIARHESGALEVLSFSLLENGALLVDLALDCEGIPRKNGGLELRDRENFSVLFGLDFPFTPPMTGVKHVRFAGSAHVQWKKHLCLYQSPSTEWIPSNGVFGYVDRLWDWIQKGAMGELDPIGGPLHPPAVYPGASPNFIVARADTPEISEAPWFGYAELKQVSEERVDIVGWRTGGEGNSADRLAAALLLPAQFPFEYPTKASELLSEVRSATNDVERFLTTLGLAALRNPKDSPLYVIVGTAMRGVRGSASLQQHLAVWHLEPICAELLRLALFKFIGDQSEQDLGSAARGIFDEWAITAPMNWCSVLEDRPQIVTRRDMDTPLSWFSGKSIALWGCGAIGGHAAESLVRAGVQRIVLRDNGKVKPGVLTRQPFLERDIGMGKADALMQRLLAINPDLKVEAHSENILGHLETEGWTKDADVIIDATASTAVLDKLELARRQQQSPPPIVSMAVSARAEHGLVVSCPGGFSGGPADVSRKMKLELCRRAHLSSLAMTFWPTEAQSVFQPEPGCSESTFIGSNADIATLSNGMLNLAARELAKVGELRASGHLVAQPYLPSNNPVVSFSWDPDYIVLDSHNNVDIRISPNALNELAAWGRRSARLVGDRVETGGVILGQQNHAVGVVWIDELTGPPPDSEASEKAFVCGVDGVDEAIKKKRERFKDSVVFLGMWHTHPRSKPLPSLTDYDGMRSLVTSRSSMPPFVVMLIAGGNIEAPELGGYLFQAEDFASGATPQRSRPKPTVFKPPTKPRSIGLALSGGGSRAIAFHLGTLRALHDRGVLDRLEVVSAVSGGSVIAAMYAYSQDDFAAFDKRVVTLLKEGLVGRLIRASVLSANFPKSIATSLTSGVSATGVAVARLAHSGVARLTGKDGRTRIQSPLRRSFSRTTAFEKALDRLFEGKKLNFSRRGDVEVVLNATELSTMSAFRFGSRESGCWRFGSLTDTTISVATAVAASAAYPALLPCLDRRYEFKAHDGELSKKRVILTDGGVYENLGVSNLEPGASSNYGFNVFKPDFIIASAAGPGIPGDEAKPYWWPARMVRSFESVHRKSQDATLKRLHGYVPTRQLHGFALPYLGQVDSKLPWTPPDLVPREDVITYPTDFSPMASSDIDRIALRGEQLTRLLLDYHCPNL